MRYAYSVQHVREAERSLMAQLPPGTLMQRAAAGLAAACADLLGGVSGRRVAVLVGSGDNGGDALYAAARLARRGAGVTAVLLSPDRAHAGGLAALRSAGGRVLPADAPPPRDALTAVRRADLILDGIVGIGGQGGLRPDAARLARAARDSRAVVVAVDLPSGISPDTGEVPGEAVRADATITFGTYKPGLLIDPAAEHTGAVHLIDIGLAEHLPAPSPAAAATATTSTPTPETATPETTATRATATPATPGTPATATATTPALEALQHADVAALLPSPARESDKYRRGVVGVVAGSQRYPGAAVLAVGGALRGGAGAVRYVGPAADAVIARFPETLVSSGDPAAAGRVQSWVVGPGLGDDARARRAVAEVLDSDVPVLVDADALRLADRDQVRARRDRGAATVLTPHAGEAAALLAVAREDVEAARLDHVRRLAAAFRATVLLKGSTTLIAGPDPAAPVRVNPTGTGWLATAGSGDVLSGLAGSLLAAGLSALDAASVGAYLHGLAARRMPKPFGARELAEHLPAAWHSVQRDALR